MAQNLRQSLAETRFGTMDHRYSEEALKRDQKPWSTAPHLWFVTKFEECFLAVMDSHPELLGWNKLGDFILAMHCSLGGAVSKEVSKHKSRIGGGSV